LIHRSNELPETTVAQQSILDQVSAAPIERLMQALFVACMAIIGIALAFEYIGGYQPCPLCLQQRYAYYAGIIGSVAAHAAFTAGQRPIARALLALLLLAFLANVGLGIYHSGVEWQWWAGPTTCSGAAGGATSAADLLNKLESVRVVRCDEAQWRFAFLSFAGWSAVLSLGLAALAAWGFRRA
jgi:disulfide bond formation protein DsbB